MTDDKKPAPKITYVNRPDAPEVFVNEGPLLWTFAGNLSLTFATARPNFTTNPVSFERVVIGRVTMPMSAAKALAQNLWSFLQAQGIDPADKSPESPMQ